MKYLSDRQQILLLEIEQLYLVQALRDSHTLLLKMFHHLDLLLAPIERTFACQDLQRSMLEIVLRLKIVLPPNLNDI